MARITQVNEIEALFAIRFTMAVEPVLRQLEEEARQAYERAGPLRQTAMPISAGVR